VVSYEWEIFDKETSWPRHAKLMRQAEDFLICTHPVVKERALAVPVSLARFAMSMLLPYKISSAV